MKLQSFIATAVLIVAPVVASAVTLTGDDPNVTNLVTKGSTPSFDIMTTGVSQMDSGDVWIYENDDTVPLFFDATFTINRLSAFKTVELSYDVNGGPSQAVTIMSEMGLGFAMFKEKIEAGDVLTIDVDFMRDATTAGDHNIDFTGSVSAIPLPAAGWMLIGGLAGLGILGRRRQA